MTISNEDKTPNKNLYQYKEYGSRKILTEFSKTQKLYTLIKQEI